MTITTESEFESALNRIKSLALNRQIDGKDLAIIVSFLLDRKKTDLHYDIVEELTSFIPPRKIVLHNSTLYRGAKEGEFAGVSFGTPVVIATSTAP